MDGLSKKTSTTGPATLHGHSVTLCDVTPAEFRKAFAGRVRQIRESLGWTRPQAAELMGVSLDAWIKYEKRTPLPHHLIPRFCRATRVDIWFLFTGERSAGNASPRPQGHRGAM